MTDVPNNDQKFVPRNVEITLILDDGRERAKAKFTMPMYEPQIEGADLASYMTATDIAVDERGFIVTLIHGPLGRTMSGWAEAWAELGLQPCTGLPALRALEAMNAEMDRQSKRRGEHGPVAEGLDKRDYLLADALVRMHGGDSQRAAVAGALEDHDPVGNEESLRQSLKRYLKRVRRPR